MARYKQPVASGGGATEWASVGAITLGGLDQYLTDNYVTAVTDHGNGEATYTWDTTKARTFVGRGTFLRFDAITEWASKGSTEYALQLRLEIITPPSNTSG